IKLQPPQQRRLAASRIAKQHQDRIVLSGLEHVPEILKLQPCAFPDAFAFRAHPTLRCVWALIKKQSQTYETLIELIARLGPFGDAAQPELGEVRRLVSFDRVCFIRRQRNIARPSKDLFVQISEEAGRLW